MLTKEAWNAFLKTLEEPPPNTVFVLATTESHKVMPTIADRCQRFDFQRPSLEQISEVLNRVAAAESIRIEDGAVAMIARSAQGSFRDALGTLDQLVAFGGSDVGLDEVLEMLGAADAELLFEAVDAVAAEDPQGGPARRSRRWRAPAAIRRSSPAICSPTCATCWSPRRPARSRPPSSSPPPTTARLQRRPARRRRHPGPHDRRARRRADRGPRGRRRADGGRDRPAEGGPARPGPVHRGPAAPDRAPRATAGRQDRPPARVLSRRRPAAAPAAKPPRRDPPPSTPPSAATLPNRRTPAPGAAGSRSARAPAARARCRVSRRRPTRGCAAVGAPRGRRRRSRRAPWGKPP